MCGIAGKHYFATDRQVDPRVLQAMTDVMSHRGPDDRGLYRRHNVALGHRRLSILDLSPAGHQPMGNEDGTVWVVFNGEIYNYKPMRRELESLGHRFHSNTDTEVIVHAYEQYGLDFVSKFRGMFAFGIWDEKHRRLVLARDHFGIKPLYYYQDDAFISFASEIKSLIEDPEVPRAVDEQALSNFITLHYVPSPRTMFAGVRKLEPGHMLVAERGSVRLCKYWELKKQGNFSLNEADAVELVYNELRSSVEERLQSDVPVGALLSGGLDSSGVLALMTDLSQKSVPAFTVGYSASGDDGFSEFKYSRIAAKHLHSDYHEVVVTADMFRDFLPKAIWHQDEPIGEPPAVPLYFVCKLAKEHGVTVLLSGEGSDELFAGYNRHNGEMFSRYYGLIPETVHRNVLDPLIRRLPRAPLLKKGHRTMMLKDWWERYQSWHTVFSPDLKEQLLNGRSAGLSNTFSDVFQRYEGHTDQLDNLDRILWMDLQAWLPDDLLMKKDKMGMATSLEARVPFLDHQFVEMAFQIPSSLKVKRLTTKYVLKKSLERLLPREIIYRKKEGFSTPIARWLSHDLRAFVQDWLCGSSSSGHGYFNPALVQRLLREHNSGEQNHERLIFPMLNFELWYDAFFRSKARNSSRMIESQPDTALVGSAAEGHI
jgi:asparagine synthase (glutamine-hydrolysing)